MGKVFSEYFGFHRLLHNHHRQHLLTCGRHNRPNSGRSTKWTQSHPVRKILVILLLLIPLIPYSYGVEVFHFSLDLYTIGMTPWTSDRPVADLYLNTGQHKHRINAHTRIKHPCPKWDSRSQRPSERRQFMPRAARLP
jgi:hypothetical protein